MSEIGIPILCTILGIIISFLTFQKNTKKDIQNETKDFIEVKTQLEYISRGIDDIKFNDRIRDDQLKTLNERLIIVESETKILFKRFERLDETYRIRDELERGKRNEHSRKHNDREEDYDN